MNLVVFNTATHIRDKFINSVEEEYQVLKRGREYHGCQGEYNMEKRLRGSNININQDLKKMGIVKNIKL